MTDKSEKKPLFSNPGLLHTPEGVRDIYNGECAKKIWVQNQIQEEMYLYGFQEIQTPAFEFFDIFNKERGTVASKEMYKFFDREGNTIVLRPDITPSIARCVAKYFKEEELPIRLCYTGDTYINHSSHQGKLNEITQVGAELMNDASVDADGEMLVLTIQSLRKAGLKEFQVEVGHADFFRGLMEEAEFDEEEIVQMKLLMESKNLFGIEDLIGSKDLNKEKKQFILRLPELFGGIENITYAKEYVSNERAKKALHRLEKLYQIVEAYGVSDFVTFDLGMLSRFDYYSGIILNAYTYGTGEAVAQGGRYDNLVGQFGKLAPAIGVAILIDPLLTALSRQKTELKTEEGTICIVYKKEQRKQAIKMASSYRDEKKKVILYCEDVLKTKEEYITYANRNQMKKLLFLMEEDNFYIEFDIQTGNEMKKGII